MHARQPSCTPQVKGHAANHTRAHTRKPTCTRKSVCSNTCAHAPATYAECQTASVHTASGQTCTKPHTRLHAQAYMHAQVCLLKHMRARTSNTCGVPGSQRAHRKWTDTHQSTHAPTRASQHARASLSAQTHARTHQQCSRSARQPACTPPVGRHATNHLRAHTRKPTCTRKHLSNHRHVHTHQHRTRSAKQPACTPQVERHARNHSCAHTPSLHARASIYLLKCIRARTNITHAVPNSQRAHCTLSGIHQTTHAPTRASPHASTSICLLKCMRARTSNTREVPNSQRAHRQWKDMHQTAHAPIRASLHAHASIRLLKCMRALTSNTHGVLESQCAHPSGKTCNTHLTRTHVQAYMHAPASVCSEACAHAPATHAECQTASVQTASERHAANHLHLTRASLQARASICVLKHMHARTSNTRGAPDSQHAHS
jgi:hypothetical protein